MAGRIEHEEATRVGNAHAFDPAVPWQRVLDQIIDDATWWRQELEEPALWLRNRVSAKSDALDGDAPIARARIQRPDTKRKEPPSSHDYISERARSHRTNDDGSRLTHNRRDIRSVLVFRMERATRAEGTTAVRGIRKHLTNVQSVLRPIMVQTNATRR